jgi:hypothetical protein
MGPESARNAKGRGAIRARAIGGYGIRWRTTPYYIENELLGGSGHEDDDWYFSFYEPYRWVLARVPLLPTVGNHDSDENEKSDDRAQLADNHYTDVRFAEGVEAGTASIGPGLFYRFDYSQAVQFVCIDTSQADRDLGVERFFQHGAHRRFVEEALGAGGSARTCWRIPFCHHPPFCAGPEHGNDQAMLHTLVPCFEQHGVRLVLGGRASPSRCRSASSASTVPRAIASHRRGARCALCTFCAV